MSEQVIFGYIAMQCLPRMEEVDQFSPLARALMRNIAQTRNVRKTKEFGSGMWQSGPSDFISINALPDSLRVRNPTCAYRFYLLHCCNFNLVGRQFRRASANANSHIKFKRDDVIYYGSVEYFIALQIEDV